ncbi:MAG: hypothetical protein GQ527_04370 [Bacteroidales bacterium]|nr:hypothetical protein [Bacteroidales bacterium]
MNKNNIWILIGLLILLGSNKVHSQISEIDYNNWSDNSGFKTRPSRFVINNKDEFKEMSNSILLNFDFTKHTIIGVQGISPGHFEPIIDIRILENEIEEKIIIEVILSGGKSCSCRVMKPHYRKVIYTDKLNSNFEIGFNFIRINE